MAKIPVLKWSAETERIFNDRVSALVLGDRRSNEDLRLGYHIDKEERTQVVDTIVGER